MDLEELQLAWTQMGEELETQKKLTKEYYNGNDTQ